MPFTLAVVIFWLSALIMAPLLCRRLYGILMTTKDGIRIRSYISTVSATIVIQMIWALLPLPYSIKFPVLSVFALLGLYGSAACLPEFKRKPLPGLEIIKFRSRQLLLIVVLILLVLLNLFNTIIHTYVLNGAFGQSDLFSLVTWGIVPLSFLFFAWFADKSRERLGFTAGIALILIGCFVALMPDGSVLAPPLLLLGEFGGTITEFCFLTMPLLFFPFTKRPILIAVSGLITHNLLSSALSWTQDLWLPDILLGEQISRPLIIFGVVCAILLFPLVFSLWEKQRDATLMAALLGFKKQAEEKTDPISPESLSYESMHVNATLNGISPEGNDWTASLDLVEQERSIALMLCDGMSRTDIEKKLNLPAAQISVHLKKIRTKLSEQPPIGRSPYVQKAVSRYGLTAREAEVFHEMVLGRSNMEICSNLYIEESTVKSHVNRILKKTGASNRAELIARLQKEENETSLLHK